jgi:trehalose/maltose hydrolase-like predicted phosphorylase
MLHHLVPDEVAPDSLEPNLAFYEPRTAHGSSLSPAVYASLFARAGDFRRALDALHIASRIDLDDLTGTTAAGVHVATMGGLWQALAFGFAGVRPGRGRLTVDPHLPPSWPAMEVRVRYRGTPVRVRVEHERFVVTCDAPVDLHAAGSDVTVGSGETTFRRADGDRRAER